VRILFLTQVLPYPLDAGAKVRAYYTLRQLAKSHEVALLSFARNDDSAESVDQLREFCTDVVTVPIRRSRFADFGYLSRAWLANRPFLVGRDWQPRMVDALQRLHLTKGPFECIHADQLGMAQYALLGEKINGSRPRTRTVLDQHNAVFQIPSRLAETESSRFKRHLLLHEAKLLARYEVETSRAFDNVVFVTSEDRTALAEKGLSQRDLRRTRVIPICVEPKADLGQNSNSRRRQNRVLSVGGLHWPPNAAGVSWFQQNVWTRVRKIVPDATLSVVGKLPESFAMPPPHSRIAYLGHVPDIEPLFEQADAFIVPVLAGGGMRVKILDAWTRGLPVISTTIGAEGIDAQHEKNILIADTPKAFAEATVSVLTNPNVSRQLRDGGLRTVEDRYDWRKVYRAWDLVYKCESSSSYHTNRT